MSATSITGYVDNTGGTGAHKKLLNTIREAALATGDWQVMRYDAASPQNELILKGLGYPGDKEIYIGFQTYESAPGDYYNILCGAFTGYAPDLTFANQPNGVFSGVPAHANRIDYWIAISPQRIAGALRISTSYETFYLGHFLPYGLPNQYPYPQLCAGMLNGAAATRFSDTSHTFPWKGNRVNLKIRTPEAWIQPYTYPWGTTFFSGSSSGTTIRALAPTGTLYTMLPIVLYTPQANLWGELEGVFYTSGINAYAEDLIVVNGVNHIMIPDVTRSGPADYIALRLD
jgi:hypothetical protein